MKMRTQLTALFGMACLFIASCSAPVEAPKPVDMEALKVDIQKIEDAYAAAEKVKDAEGVAAYYGEDAVSYNRNEEPTVGRAAIKDRIAARLVKDTTGNHNVYKVVDLFAEGTMAVEIGSWKTLNPEGQEVDKGYYMSYFQNSNGKYLCVRDMSVNSVPAKMVIK